MSRNGDVVEQNAAPSTTSSSSTIRNRTDPFLVACRCFSFFTSLAAILCIAVNFLSAVRSFKHASDVIPLSLSLSLSKSTISAYHFPLPSNLSWFQIFDGIFRCYAVLVAAFVVLAETEWSFILKFSKVFRFRLLITASVPKHKALLTLVLFRMLRYDIIEWSFTVSQWRFYLYSAAVMTRAFPDYIGDRRDLFLLQSIASYLLLGCGVVYVVSGILCIGFLKRARQKQEITREQATKDLEELERRREELEQLLLADRV
ncbi:hypothetical protein JHK85_019543 [Glycine max]|nr:hypothetical protein JHK85_019543 [Glycine max]